jgi:hypothetical protein
MDTQGKRMQEEDVKKKNGSMYISHFIKYDVSWLADSL